MVYLIDMVINMIVIIIIIIASSRFTGADAWRYQTAKEIGGSMYWGKVAI